METAVFALVGVVIGYAYSMVGSIVAVDRVKYDIRLDLPAWRDFLGYCKAYLPLCFGWPFVLLHEWLGRRVSA